MPNLTFALSENIVYNVRKMTKPSTVLSLRLPGEERARLERLARRLGRTGHQSSVAILGAAAFARSNEKDTEAAFTEALARGVNHLDIAPSYGDAERLVGPLVPAVRDKLFVGCKTHRRNADGV